MKYSLVVASKGRSKELRELLKSLQTQKENFEVIVVDQNNDSRLVPITKDFSGKLKLLHLHCEPGLSKARNLGISKSEGDIIAFPDDDCEYFTETLKKVVNFFDSHPEANGVSGKTVDRSGFPSAGKFLDSSVEITRSNIWNSHNSVSLFLKKEIVKKIGGFDEHMGLGTYFSSSEETDYVIRALKSGFKIFYDPEIKVYHPQVNRMKGDELRKRGLNYGRGVGRLLKKHRSFFSPMDFIKVFIGPIVRFALAKDSATKSFNLALLKGRIEGYIRS